MRVSFNHPEIARLVVTKLHPEVDHSATRSIDISGSFAEGSDVRVGFNHQPGALGVVAIQAQAPSNLGTKGFDVPASCRTGEQHGTGVAF